MKHRLLRVLTLALALCLAFSLCLPAFAESEDLDAQLEQVTRTVKAQLNLNTDDYSGYDGNYYEQPGGICWNLNWYGDNCSLSISLLNDTITDYYYYCYEATPTRFYGFDTTLPAHTLEEAQASAQAFLGRILAEGETAKLEPGTLNLDGPSYSFWGTILKNGLDTPISLSIDLDKDLEVTYFYRSDSYDSYIGEVDAPEAAAADQAQAAEALKSAVEMDLIWALDDDGIAQLVYLPQYKNVVVDALTGELIDMDELYANLGPWMNNTYYDSAYGIMEEAAEAAVSEPGTVRLTEAEQAAVENLEGILSAEALDAQLRSIPALGISQDAYCKASYDADSDSGKVSCTLQYNCPITLENTYGSDPEELASYLEYGNTPYYVLSVTVDARTGALNDIFSWSYIGPDQDAYQTEEELLALAKDFLSSYAPESCRDMELYSSESQYFTFARTHEGYFYLNESITLYMNPVTGTIAGMYYFLGEEETVFGSAENLVSLDQAIQAYADAGTVGLRYVAWPVAVDAADPVFAAYAEYGYNYVERLALVYTLDYTDVDVMWVDAHTGEPVLYSNEVQSQFAYSDLEGCYGKEIIETLAQFGVGFEGGCFRPTDSITQRELVQLLLNARCGYNAESYDDEMLLEEASWYGFVVEEDWNPDKAATRMDVLRAILNASEYGKAAALSGAYYCSFNDESGIRTADYGYVSIGQALGVIHGTPEGYFSAYSDCSRQDAAIMVYNFLSR